MPCWQLFKLAPWLKFREKVLGLECSIILTPKLKTFDYTGSIDVYEILRGVIANTNADAVTNLTITIKSDPGTFFINVFTLGLANAYKVEVTGDLVRLPNGISSVQSIQKEKLAEMRPDSDTDITTRHFDGIFIP